MAHRIGFNTNRNNQHFYAGSAFLALFLFAASVAAQTALEEKIVVTANIYPAPFDNLSRAVTVLTAEEIAAMDLTGVQWAVLSACDTGAGEIKAGEGVFGLQRAFAVA